MAVVRLKRALDEVPIDTLLIAYKKKKEDRPTNQTSVFKFATTLLDEKEDVFQHISKVIHHVDSKKLYKQKHISNITEKLRNENKLYSQNNRLKLVNCLRESRDLKNSLVKDSPNTEVTVLDIESSSIGTENQAGSNLESSTSGAEAKNPETTKYVYDIFYTPNTLSDIDMTTGDNEISCHIIDTELAFECYRDDAYGEDEVEEDEDDSNDENNWRNDYPDEDDNSIGEEDMKFAAQYSGLTIDDNYDLSSDEQDEDLLHSIDVSSTDVAMYGEGYAKYKRRILRSRNKQLLSGDPEDDSSDSQISGHCYSEQSA